MGYVIPPTYSRVTLEYAPASPMGSNLVTGFGVDTPPGDVLLDKVEQWWDESLKLRTSNKYTLLRIEARNDVSVEDRTIGETGALLDDPAPPNTAALIRFGTGLVGRQYRGRMYLPGVLLDSEVSDSGTINSTVQASLLGTMLYLKDLLDSADYAPVILHSGVGTPTTISSINVETSVATQRRRLRR